MRRYLIALICLGFASLIFTLPRVILAQEEEDIEMDYAWGIVNSTSSNKIVVAEYDYATDEEVDVTYTVDPETKFRGVVSLKEIKAGDNVAIDYVDTGGKKTAKIIDVERTSDEEQKEYTPSETREGEMEYPFKEKEY